MMRPVLPALLFLALLCACVEPAAILIAKAM